MFCPSINSVQVQYYWISRFICCLLPCHCLELSIHISETCKHHTKLNLLEFNVDGVHGYIGNSAKSSFGKDNGGGLSGRWGESGRSIINDLDLDSLVGDTSPWLGSTYASHQVLPSAWCSIVPYPISCCCEQIAWWELGLIFPKARRSCIPIII